MARIELRDCTVRIKDGLGAHPDIYPCTALGNKTLGTPNTAVAVGDTTCKVSSTSIPTAVAGKTQKVPVGARFTIAGETAATTVHVVTARTQDGTVSYTHLILARRLPTRRSARRIRRWPWATPPARCRA